MSSADELPDFGDGDPCGRLEATFMLQYLSLFDAVRKSIRGIRDRLQEDGYTEADALEMSKEHHHLVMMFIAHNLQAAMAQPASQA
jgi:hypothetical protein